MAEVYGIDYIETASDKLVALLNALKTTMASGYDPTFSYVYEYHNVAKLQLNAVTVELVTAESESITMGAVNYLMEFSVRVHTAYSGGARDPVSNQRLLNSIANKLRDNVDQGQSGEQYRIKDITDITPNVEFDESASLGGELAVLMSVGIAHTQE